MDEGEWGREPCPPPLMLKILPIDFIVLTGKTALEYTMPPLSNVLDVSSSMFSLEPSSWHPQMNPPFPHLSYSVAFLLPIATFTGQVSAKAYHVLDLIS